MERQPQMLFVGFRCQATEHAPQSLSAVVSLLFGLMASIKNGDLWFKTSGA